MQTVTTVATIVDRFLAGGAAEGRAHAAAHLETIRGNFENHVLPRWRERDVADITRRDVLVLHEAIAKGRPVPGRALTGRKRRPPGGPAAAVRVMASLRAMFNWAHRCGLVEVNPCI